MKLLVALNEDNLVRLYFSVANEKICVNILCVMVQSFCLLVLREKFNV